MAWSDIEYYLERNLATTLRMNGTAAPRVDYVVTPHDIALHVELGSHEQPPRSDFPMVRVDQISSEGRRMARLRIADAALRRDFHDLLCAVADRIVRQDRSLAEAFGETVQAWTALLRRHQELDTQRRIGLIGELAVLNALGLDPATGWSRAVAAWVGPQAEEHDFALTEFDIEVKSTASEARRHVVHGTAQLTPKPHRPLWLVSVQLTRGGAGGRTLGECAAAVRRRIGQHSPSQLAAYDARLAAAGWDSDNPDEERWTLRSEPLALPVDERLPRIDAALLNCIPAGLRERIDKLQYRIDVTHLTAASAPPSVLSAVSLP
ncbi:PD-(D/E)XK motif protein [Kitasatospora paracochleata]|uniref:PD-(D/E)XK family protein DUF4420 n=1 Tax=Kitasatospora paracochleata TaxID=58354 RepID=A0ABT1ITQ1_9ACTN|nr:PD-(D/E)XK motif protein [Kitasatospora paracochleata]MCP2308511.1 hypothetical protein [Kitasatospora paracochleata]